MGTVVVPIQLEARHASSLTAFCLRGYDVSPESVRCCGLASLSSGFRIGLDEMLLSPAVQQACSARMILPIGVGKPVQLRSEFDASVDRGESVVSAASGFGVDASL
ncbi:hypothetical protein BAY61_04985 [Prauserella marina]|nr:hypothetical protein BAY61_04985 [Prauserella marina]